MCCAKACCGSRSKDIIEPLIKPQWWANCMGMAEAATKVGLSLPVVFFTPCCP